MANILGRLITSVIETKKGKIHIMPNCWILSKYEKNTQLIKSKGCRYGGIKTGKLIEREDKNGDTMVLVKRRAVVCPNILNFVSRPILKEGNTCHMLFSECKKCEYHLPSSRFTKYPTCKYKRSSNPVKDTLQEVGEIIGNAVDQANRIMKRK